MFRSSLVVGCLIAPRRRSVQVEQPLLEQPLLEQALQGWKLVPRSR
jgi:hypothetical protein